MSTLYALVSLMETAVKQQRWNSRRVQSCQRKPDLTILTNTVLISVNLVESPGGVLPSTKSCRGRNPCTITERTVDMHASRGHGP